MCGIAGQFSLLPDAQAPEKGGLLRRALRHRGPDDEGTWVSPDGRVLLVQTRLAILDLSPAGHQPMEWGEGKSSVGSRQSSEAGGQGTGDGGQGTGNGERGAGDGGQQTNAGGGNSAGASSTRSADCRLPTDDSPQGRLVIVFNGEIYNFRELRAELEAAGVAFRTGTDTEVILALYAREGTRCVERLRGMFAFAIWDDAAQSAFLARDPLGIKPLYLCEGPEGQLRFASELRALAQAGLCGQEIDPAGLWSFLRFGSVAEPGTMLQGVTMLPAGHAMRWEAGQVRRWVYWTPEFKAVVRSLDPAGTARTALLDSVRAHLVSDAPVGVFLSGGLDSTVLAVLAQQAGIGELKTFSIGFAEAGYDERAAARATAEALGATHQEWCLTAGEGRELLGGFVEALDQPTIDGLNTYCVSKMAHEGGCKVVLSGLGGDEMLGGYNTFQRVPRLRRGHRWLGWLPGGRWLAGRLLRESRSPVRRRLGEFLEGPGSTVRAWEACRSLFTEREATQLASRLLGYAVEAPAAREEVTGADTGGDAVSVLELTRYMRNQLLRDSDVMSMRWGLELRVPMVDRELFAALAGLPAWQRLKPGKQLLTDAVPGIPAHILNQPKRGFTFPYAEWMKGDWMELLQSACKDSPVPLTNWYQKWALFVFQQWKEGMGESRVDKR